MPQIDNFQCTDGPDSVSTNHDVTGYFLQAADILIEFDVDFPDGYSRLEVYADASLIYDSGCINTGDSQVVTVPAGTTTLTAVVTQECSGSWDENCWTYQMAC